MWHEAFRGMYSGAAVYLGSRALAEHTLVALGCGFLVERDYCLPSLTSAI